MAELSETLYRRRYESMGFVLGIIVTAFVLLCLCFLPPGAGLLQPLLEASAYGAVSGMCLIVLLVGAVGAFLGHWVKNCVLAHGIDNVQEDHKPARTIFNEKDPLIGNSEKNNYKVPLGYQIKKPLGEQIKDGIVYSDEANIPVGEKKEYIERLYNLYERILKPIYQEFFIVRKRDCMTPAQMINEYWRFVGSYNIREEQKVYGKSRFSPLTHVEYMEKFDAHLKAEHEKYNTEFRAMTPQDHIDALVEFVETDGTYQYD